VAAVGVMLVLFTAIGYASQHDSHEAFPRISTPSILLILAAVCFALSVRLLIRPAATLTTSET
jgi:hypothetical protein